jgi:hypothetical protein
MATIIDNMTNEALTFMEQRKKIEEQRKKEMLKKNEELFKALVAAIILAGKINISYLPTFIQTELKPIIDNIKKEQINYADSFLRDDFNIGIQQAQKLLGLANEPITPYDANMKDNEYEVVLASLLLYAERVIDNQYESLLGNLNRDMTSIYILGKRQEDKKAEREVDNDKDSTLATILTGATIGKYINPTFKNINNRTQQTAQNETNRALNHGILMRYLIAKRENYKSLMVKWIDVKDERECHYCRDAAQGGDNGNGVYPMDDVTPPPLHSRCRCILIPYLSRWGDE